MRSGPDEAHILRPGGGPAKPTAIVADRVGAEHELPRRGHCGHCGGMTGRASMVRIGCLVKQVCPLCIEHYAAS